MRGIRCNLNTNANQNMRWHAQIFADNHTRGNTDLITTDAG